MILIIERYLNGQESVLIRIGLSPKVSFKVIVK